MKIKFTVYGKAVAQPRPRFTRAGHVYMPKTVTDWKSTVMWQAPMKKPMLIGALAMKLIFYLAKPKSTPRRVKYPSVKPDLDNFEKPIMDALEGICYKNDSQIVDKHGHKTYSRMGDRTPAHPERPRVEIEITELEH